MSNHYHHSNNPYPTHSPYLLYPTGLDHNLYPTSYDYLSSSPIDSRNRPSFNGRTAAVLPPPPGFFPPRSPTPFTSSQAYTSRMPSSLPVPGCYPGPSCPPPPPPPHPSSIHYPDSPPPDYYEHHPQQRRQAPSQPLGLVKPEIKPNENDPRRARIRQRARITVRPPSPLARSKVEMSQERRPEEEARKEMAERRRRHAKAEEAMRVKLEARKEEEGVRKEEKEWKLVAKVKGPWKGKKEDNKEAAEEEWEVVQGPDVRGGGVLVDEFVDSDDSDTWL